MKNKNENEAEKSIHRSHPDCKSPLTAARAVRKRPAWRGAGRLWRAGEIWHCLKRLFLLAWKEFQESIRKFPYAASFTAW